MSTDAIEIDQLDGFMQRCVDAIAGAPLQDTFRKLSPILRAGVSDNFTHSGSPFGPWPERKSKRPAGQWENPLLILSGDLYEAATSDFGAGHVEIYDVREMAIGVDPQVIPYAAVHNFGGEHMPQRQFMVVDPTVVDACVEIVTADMYAILNGVR